MTRSSAEQSSHWQKIHTTGDIISTTTTDTITVLIASAHRGTGAVITTHGIGMHGHITAHGDSTDGTITAAGTTLGITEDSMILGITEAHGASMTHGTTADGTAVGIHTTHIMQDGMVALAGILTIITIITQVMFPAAHLTRITSEVRDIRQDLSGLLQAEAVLSEAEQASEAA